jgi:hypothetical protein
MENLDKILMMWERDAEIDQTEPGRELLNIPKLHNKYLTILIKHRVASKDANYAYLRMRKLKWDYYTGRMSQEDLAANGWEPFKYVLKSDISTYIDSDNDLINLLKLKSIHDDTIFALESIMTELKSRTFQLRDFISYEKFVSGA